MSSKLGKKIEQLEEEKMKLGLDADIHKLEVEKLRKGKNKAEEDLDSLKTDYKKLHISIRTAGLGKTSEQWRQEIKEKKTRADHWEKKFQDVRVREDALKKSLLESQSEKERLRAWVAELEKSLHQYRICNSVIELKASLGKIDELKKKIEELETALQDSQIRVEILEANSEHSKEQLCHSQDQIRNRDYVMGEAVTQVRKLLVKEREKGKNTTNENEDPIYPPGFTLINIQTPPEVYPRGIPITVRPQQHQTDTSALMNYQTSSGSNLGDNPTNPVVPDLDNVAEMEKTRVELSKQLED
ncbi:uncharacterized protein LOC108481444 [Gossypium arboreum]|uniref:uncharacterized protein LOC108481444 n=1 Tax=Gossypium arboreum TaxID=29729 RepID=UPI00081976D0|nr:uncharacterized protein LOC108481444 [Gossypium arboreum]